MFWKKKVEAAKALGGKKVKFEIIEAVLNPIGRSEDMASFSGLTRLAEALSTVSAITSGLRAFPLRQKQLGMNVLLPVMGRLWGCKQRSEEETNSTCSETGERCYLEDIALCNKYEPDFDSPIPLDLNKAGKVTGCLWCGTKFSKPKEAGKLSNLLCNECKDKVLNYAQERTRLLAEALKTIKEGKIVTELERFR